MHPGEQLQYIGCHENKWEATPPANPIAFGRPPSRLTPNLEDGSCPISYARLVQPILSSRGSGLSIPQWHLDGGTDGCWGVNRDGYRSIPGQVGAQAVGLDSILFSDPWASRLTSEDVRRLILWVDALCMTSTANFDYSAQNSGQVVWPNHEVDPANPAGTEDLYGFSVPGEPPVIQGALDKNMAEKRFGSISYNNGILIIANLSHAHQKTQLYDMHGRIAGQFIVPAGTSMSIDLPSRLPAGIYVARLEQNSAFSKMPILVPK